MKKITVMMELEVEEGIGRYAIMEALSEKPWCKYAFVSMIGNRVVLGSAGPHD